MGFTFADVDTGSRFVHAVAQRARAEAEPIEARVDSNDLGLFPKVSFQIVLLFFGLFALLLGVFAAAQRAPAMSLLEWLLALAALACAVALITARSYRLVMCYLQRPTKFVFLRRS